MTAIRDLFPFGDLGDAVVDAAARRFPGLPTAEVAAGFALGKAIIGTLETIAGVLDDVGLTPARWRLLMALVLQSPAEGATIGELAGHLQVREPTVTATVDRLEREGLVDRHRSEVDRRVVRVTVTPAGATTVAALVPRIAARLSTFVGAMGGPAATREVAARLVAAGEYANDRQEERP